ncbi:MAG: porin [Alphaproteobacteria bacterium]|nr:porin [Alphaproteobacteria bacterium]
MNIKSLLLGSAAAMVAVSGASAADAIIAAEPEPVEYVRVCDAFGSGYFYIPGTETCLRISGNVRFRLGFEETIAADAANGVLARDSYDTATRARVQVSAKSDTEWGELHSYIRLQAENSSTANTAAFNMDQGYIEIAGLHVGYDDSAWAYSTNGGLSGYGAHGIFGGNYGFTKSNMIQYQFGGGNWFGAISLEDDGVMTTYTPDVIGRLGGVVGGITVFAVVAYDEANAVGTSEWAAKLALNADIGANGNLRVQGFYASGATRFGANTSNGFATPGTSITYTPEWSILGSYQHQFTPEVAVYVAGQWFSDFYSSATGAQTGLDGWRASGGISWDPVDNLNFGVAINYFDLDAPVNAGNGDWRVIAEMVRSF